MWEYKAKKGTGGSAVLLLLRNGCVTHVIVCATSIPASRVLIGLIARTLLPCFVYLMEFVRSGRMAYRNLNKKDMDPGGNDRSSARKGTPVL